MSKLDNCCKEKLSLSTAKLSAEYYYQSLPLCLIDAVFSIGIRYTTTRNVVIRFCDKLEIKRLREHGSSYPTSSNQFSVDDLLDILSKNNIKVITNDYFGNRCRTSSTNGILKSEAVLKFAKILNKYGVNYFQDLEKIVGNIDFEADIKKIAGQGSGISTTYFYMLAGEDNYIKPDRIILRFIEKCVGKAVDPTTATKLLEESHKKLQKDFPNLTLRELDHEIWKHSKIK